MGFGIDIFGNIEQGTVTGNVVYGGVGEYDGIIVESDGSLLYYPSNVTISGNIIADSYRNGIDACGGTSIIVTGNVISHVQNGAGVFGGNATTIIGNTITDCANGIMMAGIQETVIGNTITDSSYFGVSGGDGFSIYPSGSIIANNKIQGGGYSGINLQGDSTPISNVAITSNVISDFGQAGDSTYFNGINLNHVVNSIISQNIIFDDQTAKTQGYGIYVTANGGSEDFCLVEGNVLVSNEFGAVWGNFGSNCTISGNIGYP